MKNIDVSAIRNCHKFDMGADQLVGRWDIAGVMIGNCRMHFYLFPKKIPI
jgi:phosphopentomutase